MTVPIHYGHWWRKSAFISPFHLSGMFYTRILYPCFGWDPLPREYVSVVSSLPITTASPTSSISNSFAPPPPSLDAMEETGWCIGNSGKARPRATYATAAVEPDHVQYVLFRAWAPGAIIQLTPHRSEIGRRYTHFTLPISLFILQRGAQILYIYLAFFLATGANRYRLIPTNINQVPNKYHPIPYKYYPVWTGSHCITASFIF